MRNYYLRIAENPAERCGCEESRVGELLPIRHIVLGEAGQDRSEVEARHPVWMRTGDMFRMLPFGNANMAFHVRARDVTSTTPPSASPSGDFSPDFRRACPACPGRDHN